MMMRPRLRCQHLDDPNSRPHVACIFEEIEQMPTICQRYAHNCTYVNHKIKISQSIGLLVPLEFHRRPFFSNDSTDSTHHFLFGPHLQISNERDLWCFLNYLKSAKASSFGKIWQGHVGCTDIPLLQSLKSTGWGRPSVRGKLVSPPEQGLAWVHWPLAEPTWIHTVWT